MSAYNLDYGDLMFGVVELVTSNLIEPWFWWLSTWQ